MVSSAKRAKRKRLAQEAQRRETSRSSHQMDPVDLSEHGTGLEEEDIYFRANIWSFCCPNSHDKLTKSEIRSIEICLKHRSNNLFIIKRVVSGPYKHIPIHIQMHCVDWYHKPMHIYFCQ